MRKIDKQPEPRAWRDYRTTPGVRYQSQPCLIEALLEEQGYICAYCERRIPYQDVPGQEDYRIEHLSSQAKAREEGDNSDLDYNNMVICCPGNITKDGPAHYHCDKRKGMKPLVISPLSEAMMRSIRFTDSGLIKSTDAKLDEELGEEGLNLNDGMLRNNRRETWLTVIEGLNKMGWTKRHVEQVLECWSDRHEWQYETQDGMKTVRAYIPYCSMAVFMLSRKLRQWDGK